MLYECDKCNQPLPPNVTKCPNCGEIFDNSVPADAEIPTHGFTAKGEPPLSEVSQSATLKTSITPDPSLVLGLAGSVIMFLGVFAPILSVPVLGTINYIWNGRGDGIFMVVLAVLSLVITGLRKYRWLWFTGAAALGILSFTYLNFQATMASATSSMDASLSDNPFKGIGDALVQSVQIQWGFGVLIVAAFFLISAAAFSNERDQLGKAIGRAAKTRAAICAGCLFLVIFASSFAYTQNVKSSAEAEAKSKAAEAQQAADAEQSKEAADQADKDNAINKVELKDWNWESEDDGNLQYLVGKVYNGSDRTFSYLSITFDILDSDGNKTGTAEDTVMELAPGQTWKFKAMADAQGNVKARLNEITGTAE